MAQIPTFVVLVMGVAAATDVDPVISSQICYAGTESEPATSYGAVHPDELCRRAHPHHNAQLLLSNTPRPDPPDQNAQLPPSGPPGESSKLGTRIFQERPDFVTGLPVYLATLRLRL